MDWFDGERPHGTQEGPCNIYATICWAPDTTFVSVYRSPSSEHLSSPSEIFRNKLAQVIASLFRADYPEGWPTFFSDIQSALLSVNTSNNDLNAGHAAMFLDILLAIDSEIISTETARSAPERAFVTSIVRILSLLSMNRKVI